MKVLIEKTLNQAKVVEIPDDLSEDDQQKLAAVKADEMRLPGDCEWVCTDFFRTAKEGEELDINRIHGHTVDEEPLVEWFDVG
jgi:hypothetical protein